MAKFIKRLGTKKLDFLIAIKVLSLELNAKETVQRLTIEWVRGDQKSETKKFFSLQPEESRITFDEPIIFTKESVFYLHTKTNKYDKKDCFIRVKGYTESTGYKSC